MQASHLHRRNQRKTKTSENAAANPVEKDGATHIKTSDTKNQNMTEDNTGSDGRFSEAANTEDVEVNSNTSAESRARNVPD